MAKETILLQGPSKVGKTTELYFLTEYLAKLYPPGEFKARLITGDGGGSDPFIDSGLVDMGVVDILELSNIGGMLVDTMEKVTKGYWPDSKGFLAMNDECQKDVMQGKIKAYFFETISSISDLLRQHMMNQGMSKDGKVAGFAPGGVWQEGDTTTVGLSQAHIGVGQNKITSWINFANKLPVDWVVWTSHEESKFSAKHGGEVILPSIRFGNAENGKLSQKFQSHFRLTIKQELVEDENGNQTLVNKHLCFFKTHNDPISEVSALCGVRLLPSWIPQFDKWFPGGYIESKLNEGSLVRFFKAKQKMRQWQLKQRT